MSGAEAARNGVGDGTVSSHPLPAAIARALAAGTDPLLADLATAYDAAMRRDEAGAHSALERIARCLA